MNARTKFIIGGVLIMGTATYLMASSIRNTGLVWLTPTELHAMADSNPRLVQTGVKVGGLVVPGSIVRSESGKELSFVATDGARELKVFYAGLAPDTFADSAEVILTGKLRVDGVFEARELLAKCASRFEAAPDPNDLKYRQTPGYKARTKVGA